MRMRMSDPRLSYKSIIRVFTVPVWRPVATREISFGVFGNLGLKTHRFIRFPERITLCGAPTFPQKGEKHRFAVNPALFLRANLFNKSSFGDILDLVSLVFFLGLFCAQDVAVMEYPGLTDMSKGLRCLTCTSSNSPLFSVLVPFNARELDCSLPRARPQSRFTQKHGEKPERQHQGPASFQLHRPCPLRF